LSKKITLYQKSSTGKIKFLTFWTDGPKFYTSWGQLDGKTQTTIKECVGMNAGKANETTPAEQAIAEMDAKIVIKKKEGYDTKMPSKTATTIQAKIDLDNIPEAFCPNKPISDTPQSIIDGKETYGQRKYDGHCLFLVKGQKASIVYSRRMEDKSEIALALPPIVELMSKLPKGTFVLSEFVYYSNATKQESPRHVAQVIRQTDAAKALDRFNELSKDGKFYCVPFDALFIDDGFIGNRDYTERAALLRKINVDVPEIYPDWKTYIDHAKKENWEGFVLRVPGEKSHISYTMDGEAHRAGSYKFKFVKTEDYFVTEWIKGKSGKHAKFYAKFGVAQYSNTGKIIDRGYVGPGVLTHDELKDLTVKLDDGTTKKNFVVEVTYQGIQDSGKLQFGIIQRLRPDKAAKECVSEE
jgi:ATP-dependent DNA ligase